MKERRSYQRTPVELPAHYILEKEGDLSKEATVINISAGGFCFYAQQSIPSGTAVELNIELKANQEVKIRAKTAWAKKVGDTGDYMVGVKIDDTGGTDLEKFLNYYSREISQFIVDLKSIKKE